MKAHLTAGLMLMTLQPCAAQSWCPPGAEWTHAYADVSFGGGHGITRVVYEGDSQVGGFMAQKLRETNVIAPWGSDDYTSTTNPNPMLTRFADGVVYQWNEWPGEYDTLMWFNAAPGQYWASPGLEDGPDHRITVLDTSTVIIGGVPLRELTVQWGTWDWMPPDTLRERIGFSMNYLNGSWWFLTDLPWVGLRCYRDSELSFYASGETDCGFTLSIDNARKGVSAGVFPNPGTDHFTLNDLAPGTTFRIYDTTGRCIFTDRTTSERFEVDASAFAPGVYHIRLEDGKEGLSWIKE